MPTIQYRISFYRNDGAVNEEQWYTEADTAWEVFRLFAEPDSAELYYRIDLTEVNWEERQDYPLAAMTFPA